MKLIIEDDEGRKTVVPFVRDEITIGRQEGNTIRLTERNVSRRHARLLRQNGHILVEDLGSYNGIRINGDRIQGQVQVNEGDLIQIGDYDLAVQREASEAAAAAHDKTQEVEALARNGASHSAPTTKLPDMGSTGPGLPALDPGATLSGEEPDEANPDDVTLQPMAVDEAAQRRQSTAIIRMDQVEQNRARQIVDIDAAEAPRLVILNTELAGREFSLVRTELKVGRTDDNDIGIDHRSLSRTHCKIVREDNLEWRVIDMQSANGLMVNGESYAQSALRNGDVLELGHVKLKFIGAGEKYDARDAVADEARGGRSKAPLIAGVAVVLMIAAAAGVWVMTKKPPKPQPGDNNPTTNVDPKTGPRSDTPDEVTPEQQRASVETKLRDARAKIDSMEWVEARKLLEACFIGESMHPEATKLLTELKAEEPLRAAIDKAERLIEQDKLADAKDELQSAEHTRFCKRRFDEVNDKLSKATQKKLQENTVGAREPQENPQPTPPRPQPVVVPAPPKATPRDDATKIYEEAQALYKAKDYKTARVRLEKCIKIDATFPECHMKLGATFAQLGDGPAGLKHYENFLKLAPDHPQASKVRALIEQYKQGNK